LIADFVHHEAGKAPDGRLLEVPFFTLEYDFVLRKGT
jgi:hydroxyquinol 1,2-dioxygenase